jgi:glycosyltransferase involved in cell wall biosynthesis
VAALQGSLRKPLATLLWPLLRPVRAWHDRGRDGGRLRPGITAVVAARDEAYTIRLCLRSLVGFADQIVCIDNGSDDRTLQEMEAFRDEHGDRVQVDVVSMPGALLGECREEGLRLTRHRWHLRWDADMIAKTSGPDSMTAVRDRALRDDRPRTIQLPRTNLIGDLRHTHRLGGTVDPGEPILMRFGRGIEYREFGKFDAVRVPLHYAARGEPGRHYFHLAGLKSDDNLIHRFHYFAWREAVNRDGDALDPELRTFEGFKRRRNDELFGTNEPRALKFRYQRQLSYHLALYDPGEYGDYPDVLRDELSKPQRFEVVYRDGRPWTRIDREDDEMAGYEPTAADLAWDPEAFLRRFLSAEQCRAIGIAPA